MSEPGEFALQTLPPVLLPLSMHVPVLPSDVVQVAPIDRFAQELTVPDDLQSVILVDPGPDVVPVGHALIALLEQYEPCGHGTQSPAIKYSPDGHVFVAVDLQSDSLLAPADDVVPGGHALMVLLEQYEPCGHGTQSPAILYSPAEHVALAVLLLGLLLLDELLLELVLHVPTHLFDASKQSRPLLVCPAPQTHSSAAYVSLDPIPTIVSKATIISMDPIEVPNTPHCF